MWRRRRPVSPCEVQIIVGHLTIHPPGPKSPGLQSPVVVIPTDLLVTAWRQLFPAERMLVFGGRRTAEGVRVTSVADVTEPQPTLVHVRACSAKLSRALIDFERTGAHFAVWVHSHPGEGANATHPSSIDTTQDAALRRHYSPQLVNIIAVRDGCFRLWGAPLENGILTVQWDGRGVERSEGAPHVYRLALS